MRTDIQKIYVGGWFQRTTLHLSEIFNFLTEGTSPLDLDPKKLLALKEALHLESVALDLAGMELIVLRTKDGIEVKIFEDGLIVLGKEPSEDTKQSIADLTAYYETRLSPAFSYIFSLGAPVPKELANIKTIYPYFVVLKDAAPSRIHNLLKEFEQEESFEIKDKTFEIYRGDKLYIINNKTEKPAALERFIQEQIFIREFKGQLHRYLNLHRIIWERIAEVKEKGAIKGSQVDEFSAKIESYAKTINLIDARINQMGAYISTRESIFKNDPQVRHFAGVLQYKYETLSDTLSYIKDIWGMTKNYVDSALSLFSSIQAKSTESSVENLTIITSMGVGATLMGLFAQEAPEFTVFGVGYFFVLAIVGFLANKIMSTIARRRMYEISDTEITKDIK